MGILCKVGQGSLQLLSIYLLAIIIWQDLASSQLPCTPQVIFYSMNWVKFPPIWHRSCEHSLLVNL